MRMQTAIDGPSVLASASARRIADDPEHLSARLHARRSRMAEGPRLDALCRIRDLQEYFQEIFPGSEFSGVLDFQRTIIQGLIEDISGLRYFVAGPGADLIDRMLVRFQVEDLKMFIRVCMTKSSLEDLYGSLVPLPRELALDVRRLAAAGSVEDIVPLVPRGFLRKSLMKAVEIYHDSPGPFFFEAALDRGYFQGLLAAMEMLPRDAHRLIQPMICQEADIFNLMLVLRGRFRYDVAPDMMLPLHVRGGRIIRSRFEDMLKGADLQTVVGLTGLRVIDEEFVDRSANEAAAAAGISPLEKLAWQRYVRLANHAFHRSHMGLGTIIGYAGLRRVEAANLITISEGIRGGMAVEKIRGRMVLLTEVEGLYV